MRPSRILAVIGLTTLPLVPVLLAAPSAAAPPVFERIDIDEQHVAVHLSADCGFTIIASVHGFLTIRTSDRDQGLVEVGTANITTILSGPGGEITLRDRGANLVQVTPDGDVILSVVGQVPFDFTGALKVDLITEEVLLEPHHLTGDQRAEACAALAG